MQYDALEHAFCIAIIYVCIFWLPTYSKVTCILSKQAHISYEAKTARDLLVAIGTVGTFVTIGTFDAIGT